MRRERRSASCRVTLEASLPSRSPGQKSLTSDLKRSLTACHHCAWELTHFGAPGTFLGYGLLALAALVFVLFAIPETKGKSLEELEKRHILCTLAHTEWNKSKAAEILGIERSTLDRKIKAYDLKK